MRISFAVLITGLLATGPAWGAPTTELSKKARAVQTGQSRAAVIAQLGRPTWVRLPAESEEKFLELLWDSGKCAPVAVDFDPGSERVTGSSGRALLRQAARGNAPRGEAPVPCVGRTSEVLQVMLA